MSSRMRATIICLATIVSGSPGVGTSASPSPLRDAALKVLISDLAAPGSAFSRDMIAQISDAADLPDDSVRVGLGMLLKELGAERQARTSRWRALTSLGGREVDEKKMDRLLREFIGWGHRAMNAEKNYGLALAIERAADKAKLSTHLAADLLAVVAAVGLTGEPAASDSLPAKLGVLIHGASDYPVDAGRFVGMLLTEADIAKQTRFRDLHTRVVPGLVAVLPQLSAVRWAIDLPDQRLSPDCILNVNVVEFYSRPVNRDISLFAVLRITLSTTEGALLYSTEIEASYDFWLETDSTIRGKRLLDSFVETIVSAIRDDLSRFLESRDG